VTTLLHLDASARGATSLSRRLSREYADAWLMGNPAGQVVYRDLVLEPLPLLTDSWVSAAFSEPGGHDAAARFALSRSDALVDELTSADVVVIGAPVYNFSVPAALKAWIDLVARVGRTFRYGEAGPVGLLSGTKVVVVATSGSGPEALAAMGMDHHASYLRGFFAFLGLTDVEVVSAFGAVPEVLEQTTAAATERLRTLATERAAVAA
jgi:FMN-dependent NADH-azoreductase